MMKSTVNLLIAFLISCALQANTHVSESPANRLTYLSDGDPFHPHLDFPKLTTPQWIGEKGVEAVVTLGIDDMRGPEKYEAFLRPILERLKKIDGRAPVSILTNSFKPDHPQAQTWLQEGLTIEVHTLTHPCPLLQQGNFRRAADVVHGGVDLLHGISGNHPVAYRMPCCDSMNSLSPRFFAEIFNQVSPKKKFLQIDSSVFNIATSADKDLPQEWVLDKEGRERFAKYLPRKATRKGMLVMGSYVGTIENYPYPYVIGKLCWEFPCVVPSDWEAQNLLGKENPQMLEDWKRALDITVLKQGVMNLCFHPHGWSSSEQFISLIDYASKKYGKKVKFLTFRECLDRLNENLLKGNSLRNSQGGDNGVRIVDVDDDGYMDVLIGNGTTKVSRVWQPMKRNWNETKLPFSLTSGKGGRTEDFRVLLGALNEDGMASVIAWNTAPIDSQKKSSPAKTWKFDGKQWQSIHSRVPDGISKANRILRDVNGNGICELIAGNRIFEWSTQEGEWEQLPYGLPDDISLGKGLRFIDLNKDGVDDLVFSDPEHWGVYLWTGLSNAKMGWGDTVGKGRREDKDAIPMISRGGEHPNNGAWFHSNHLWVQNEDTANLPDKVDRRSFKKLLALDIP